MTDDDTASLFAGVSQRQLEDIEGVRARRERARRRDVQLASKPPGHLAIIEGRPSVLAYGGLLRTKPVHRIFRCVDLRGLSAAELAAAGPGGRALRRERRRRAFALLLGALELRFALLRCFPECRSSLWQHGVPSLSGIARGPLHGTSVKRTAARRWFK